jgi:hypothetical protein
MPDYNLTPIGGDPLTVTGTRPFDKRKTGGPAGALSLVDATGSAASDTVFADNRDGDAIVAAIITAANNSPVNTVLPTITGTAKVAQVLTAVDGTWTGTPAPTKTRQWFADGVAIAGATGATYTPVAGDIGKVVTVTVTGTNTAGTDDATSAGTAAVIA